MKGLIDSSVQLVLNSANPDSLMTTLSKDDNYLILSNHSCILSLLIFAGHKLLLSINKVF